MHGRSGRLRRREKILSHKNSTSQVKIFNAIDTKWDFNAYADTSKGEKTNVAFVSSEHGVFSLQYFSLKTKYGTQKRESILSVTV